MYSALRYFNRIQADLQAIHRPQIEALNSIRLCLAVNAQIQRNLHSFREYDFTCSLEEGDTSAPELKAKDARLLFGDIY